MTKDNQFAFIVNTNIDRHSHRVTTLIIQTNRRREIDFNISQVFQNNIDSNFDSLQIRISAKRVLQNIIAATNNQFAKRKRKRLKNSKNIARFDALSRTDFSVFLYAFRRSAFVTFFSRNIRRVFERIVERNAARATRAKQAIKRQEIENDADVIDVDDHMKETLRNLNDDKFVNLSQYLHESVQAKFASQTSKRKRRRRQQIEYREKKSLNFK